MSLNMYQNNIARLTRDIAGLEKQSGEETQRIAKLYREISSITNSITKHTNQITARSKLRQINSKQEQIAQSQKILSDIQNKISTKLSDIAHRLASLGVSEEDSRQLLETVRTVKAKIQRLTDDSKHKIVHLCDLAVTLYRIDEAPWMHVEAQLTLQSDDIPIVSRVL